MNKSEFDYIMNFHDKKQQAKMLLETFAIGKKNMFEYSADLVIKNLISDKKKSSNEILKLNRKNNKSKFDESPTEEEFEIISHEIDNYYRVEELNCVTEMKIIYLYRFFEINLKKLLTISFSNANVKNLYQWQSIITFLRNKNIEPKLIDNYHDINIIRELNNSLKHSSSIENSLILRIPEFKDIDEINYKHFQRFYVRVKNAPLNFLHDLSMKIYDELYEFTDEKIQGISDELALRMNKQDVDILIKKLKKSF